MTGGGAKAVEALAGGEHARRAAVARGVRRADVGDPALAVLLHEMVHEERHALGVREGDRADADAGQHVVEEHGGHADVLIAPVGRDDQAIDLVRPQTADRLALAPAARPVLTTSAW